MIFIDRLLASGVRFVLGTLSTVADKELNDASRLREQLMEAEMRLELGEISEAEFADIERDVAVRLREIRERELAGAGAGVPRETMHIKGIEISVDDDVGR